MNEPTLFDVGVLILACGLFCCAVAALAGVVYVVVAARKRGRL
jgi:hypothetical protein